MKTTLHFDFSVDKENKTIHVTKAFAADINHVWEAWTQPQLLDQWWAPKPWKAQTKEMNFTEGGHWLYAMVGPENETHWSRSDYEKIDTQKSFTGLDAFCDENGVVNKDLPQTGWQVTFEQQSNSTLVHVTNTFKRLEDLEQLIEMGFKEGFTMALENLDELLSK